MRSASRFPLDELRCEEMVDDVQRRYGFDLLLEMARKGLA